jgi:TonB family protein
VALDKSDKKKTVEKETPPKEVKKEEVKKEPEINKKALFPGKAKKKSTAEGEGSQGIAGGEGNQGKSGGNPDSKRYDGEPGKGGMGYSLSGRSAAALPKPNYDSNKEGKVVVKIWVDRNGKVVRAEPGVKGSTTTDASLMKRAKDAAMQSSFTPNADAPEQQVGTITYYFRKYN